ncbi:MAG: hypothetical protein HW421_299 [Ignavibacteria bacterium]|nr:hypothetical protein [Ignavibacteria bacterium]
MIRDYIPVRFKQSWLGQLLYKIYLNFKTHILRSIIVNCECCEIFPDSMEVSGWIATIHDISRIDILLDGKIVGVARFNLPRFDVSEFISFRQNKNNFGFFFNTKLPFTLDISDARRNIEIIIITKKHVKKVSINNVKNLYQKWIEKNETDSLELDRQKKFELKKSHSIGVVIIGTDNEKIRLTTESIECQTYSNWNIINPFECDYITFIYEGDSFAPFAFFEMVRAIAEFRNPDFLYSDEDKFDESMKFRIEPYFKPDFSPDTLRSMDYIRNSVFFSKKIISLYQTLHPELNLNNSEDLFLYGLILFASENSNKIVHIPKILYHKSCNIFYENYSERALKALAEHCKRTGIDAIPEPGLINHTFNLRYSFDHSNKISIIIPNKDNVDELKSCIESIKIKSSYENYEIIIIENGSLLPETFQYYYELTKLENIKVLKWEKPFNYPAINNFAAGIAEGSLLLFLNNDTEVISNDWLERMAEHALRYEIGAVGAKLYYSDDSIQHGGVILGVGLLAAGHAHKGFTRTDDGYFGRLKIVLNLSAVTGACLMTRKDLYLENEGFDERFAVGLNDIDYCLRLRNKGLQIIWTPYAELYHKESITRGVPDTSEKKKQWMNEVNLFRNKWKEILEKGDPFYNVNLTLHRENFWIKYEQ